LPRPEHCGAQSAGLCDLQGGMLALCEPCEFKEWRLFAVLVSKQPQESWPVSQKDSGKEHRDYSEELRGSFSKGSSLSRPWFSSRRSCQFRAECTEGERRAHVIWVGGLCFKFRSVTVVEAREYLSLQRMLADSVVEEKAWDDRFGSCNLRAQRLLISRDATQVADMEGSI
jgi:hypothetical protein